MGKPKVAFFDFTCCEGCQIEFTNYGDAAFLELIKHVDVVEFREAMSEKTTDPIDIAFIEGSFTREADRARLEKIRERAAIVIAYGQCASGAGINALKNHQTDYKQFVYGADADQPQLDSQKAQPISAAIKVDYMALGCPVNKYEVLQIVFHLLHGKQPVIPNYPVCVECKRNENECVFAKGMVCMGPVTRGGCDALCPGVGQYCVGCRGFVDQPEKNAALEIFRQHGLSMEEARKKMTMFNAFRWADR